MRYLLTPITVFVWFGITYYALFYSMLLIFWVFHLNLFLLICCYLFLLGCISALTSGLGAFVQYLILKFYKSSWFSIIVHSIAGILGCVLFYYKIRFNPPTLLSSGEEEILTLKVLWSISWLKTLLLIQPFVGLQLGLIIQFIFKPIYIKCTPREDYNRIIK